LKSRKCDEVTAQKHVERLHDLVGITLGVVLHKGASEEHRSRLTMVKHIMNAHIHAQG
jgi:hypothetical protein